MNQKGAPSRIDQQKFGSTSCFLPMSALQAAGQILRNWQSQFRAANLDRLDRQITNQIGNPPAGGLHLGKFGQLGPPVTLDGNSSDISQNSHIRAPEGEFTLNWAFSRDSFKKRSLATTPIHKLPVIKRRMCVVANSEGMAGNPCRNGS